jgi:hypothetical protein
LEKKISGLDAELGLSERYKPDRDVAGLADAIFDDIIDYEDDLEDDYDDGLSVLNQIDSIYGGLDREFDPGRDHVVITEDEDHIDRIFALEESAVLEGLRPPISLQYDTEQPQNGKPLKGILQNLSTDYVSPNDSKARKRSSLLLGLLPDALSSEDSNSSFEDELFEVVNHKPSSRSSNQKRIVVKESPQTFKPKSAPSFRR